MVDGARSVGRVRRGKVVDGGCSLVWSTGRGRRWGGRWAVVDRAPCSWHHRRGGVTVLVDVVLVDVGCGPRHRGVVLVDVAWGVALVIVAWSWSTWRGRSPRLRGVVVALVDVAWPCSSSTWRGGRRSSWRGRCRPRATVLGLSWWSSRGPCRGVVVVVLDVAWSSWPSPMLRGGGGRCGEADGAWSTWCGPLLRGVAVVLVDVAWLGSSSMWCGHQRGVVVDVAWRGVVSSSLTLSPTRLALRGHSRRWGRGLPLTWFGIAEWGTAVVVVDDGGGRGVRGGEVVVVVVGMEQPMGCG